LSLLQVKKKINLHIFKNLVNFNVIFQICRNKYFIVKVS